MSRKLSVSQVLRQKHQIEHDLDMLGWFGTAPTGADFENFVEEIRKRLPWNLSFEAVYSSLGYLAGQEITDKNFDAAVWRLLGNLERLKRYEPVYPWSSQDKPEWMPVQVLFIDRQVSHRGDPGGDFGLQILAGSACPMVIRKFWTRKFVSVLSRRLGFSKPWHAYPFRDVLELTNLRFQILVTPELSSKGPGFEEVQVSNPQVTWNRRYLRLRHRQAGHFDCPRGYPISQPCWSCHVGLDKCPAAVHAKTFVQKICPYCNDEEAWFDPSHAERKMCIDCYHQKLLKRKLEE